MESSGIDKNLTEMLGWASYDAAKVIQVIITSLLRRGEGTGSDDQVRIVRQFWSLDGKLIAEVDPMGVLSYEGKLRAYHRVELEKERHEWNERMDDYKKKIEVRDVMIETAKTLIANKDNLISRLTTRLKGRFAKKGRSHAGRFNKKRM